MEIDRRAFIASLGGATIVAGMDHEARADALEHYAEHQLDESIAQNQPGGSGIQGQDKPFPTVAEIEAQIDSRSTRRGVGSLFVSQSRQRAQARADAEEPHPRRLLQAAVRAGNHVLQSATRAMKTGMKEEVVLACLLHDVVLNLIKVDHGWWGAQLFEPYIPEKSSFAIRYHQTLRFFPEKKQATGTPTPITASSASTTCRRRTSRRPTRCSGTTSGTWSRGSLR